MNRILMATRMCHLLLGHFLGEGQRVVDATAGNGADTLFLAEKVGPSGQVYAFDIQEEALSRTRERLVKHNCLKRVKIILDSHENLMAHISEPVHGFIYNLGYLPGGDKSITTGVDSTVKSLEQAIELLVPGGVLAVVVYVGHPGGPEEGQRVKEFFQALPWTFWRVFAWNNINGDSAAPFLLLAQKEVNL